MRFRGVQGAHEGRWNHRLRSRPPSPPAAAGGQPRRSHRARPPPGSPRLALGEIASKAPERRTMLTLYGNLDSGNVYKVRLLMAQLDIAHRRIDVAQVRGEPASREFRAINPIGKVPAIRFEDGRVLSESGAILYMLARGTAFFPDDPWPAAQVLRWMFFEQYSHEPYIAVNRYILRYAPDAERPRLIDRVPANKVRGY